MIVGYSRTFSVSNPELNPDAGFDDAAAWQGENGTTWIITGGLLQARSPASFSNVEQVTAGGTYLAPISGGTNYTFLLRFSAITTPARIRVQRREYNSGLTQVVGATTVIDTNTTGFPSMSGGDDNLTGTFTSNATAAYCQFIIQATGAGLDCDITEASTKAT